MTQKIVQTTEHQLSVTRGTIKRQEEDIRRLTLALSQHQRSTKNKKQPVVNKHKSLPRDRPSSSSEDDRLQTGKDSPPYARSTRASLLRQSTNSPTSSDTSTPATSMFSSASSSDGTKQAPKPVVINGTAYTYKSGKMNRWRSSSTSGPRTLLGKAARIQGAARRGSFSVWEENKSIF